MENFRCKILSLDFHHLKNTNHGHIDFLSIDDFLHNEEGNPNVFGIYGQNGSGKSTAILALAILQTLFQERPLGEDVGFSISGWSEDADVSLSLAFELSGRPFMCDYSVRIKKQPNGSFAIDQETLSSKYYEGRWLKYAPTYSVGQSLDPGTIFGSDTNLKSLAHSLLVDTAKSLGSSLVTKRSVIFDPALRNAIASKKNPESAKLCQLVGNLSNWAVGSFIVSSVVDQGCIETLGLLPLRIRHQDQTGGLTGAIPINLFEQNSIPAELFKNVQEALNQFNIVVPAFLPNAKIRIRVIDDANKAQPGKTAFELMSLVNGYEIPLRNESDGTKRIISLCSSLFACYGDDAVVMVVDEFDAGIFEYLFGEIIEVLSKGAAGQLVFTSHNLRPLEVLAPSSLILTTTDPENRYEFFKGLKTSNNPRDVYLRNAFLHHDDDHFYQPTNEYDITKAFMKIGDLYHGNNNA
jgi:energy-coupling factor transporter ATP-binding protein EcfA2